MGSPGSLSAESWGRAEADALVRHVSPLIRREHLALVLAELCERVLPIWQRAEGASWLLPWCLAVLRAWALGEASPEEVRRTVLDADDLDDAGQPRLLLCDDWERPYLELRTADFADDAPAAVGAAVAHAMEVVGTSDVVAEALAVVEAVTWALAVAEEDAATRSYERWIDALDAEADAEAALDDRRPDEDLTDAQHAARAERWEAERAAAARVEGAWRRGLEAGLALTREVVRSAVPYRCDRATDWRLEHGFVRTGGAVLRLDGWRLVDSVPQRELLALTGARAVAWDEAQARAGYILFGE